MKIITGGYMKIITGGYMKRINWLIFTVFMVSMIAAPGVLAGPKMDQDPAVAAFTQRVAKLQNLYGIAKNQWYDIYTDGLVPGADDAAKMIVDAQTAFTAGDTQKATTLLDSAEKLLGTYSKADLPVYDAPEPMKNPNDLGSIHLATIKELKMLDYAGVPRWNYWFNFVGTGDDGEQYMAYVCVNHHGTGKVTLPVLFAVSSTKNPDEVRKLNFNTMPVYSETPDSSTYTVKEKGRSLKYTLAKGKVSFEYKDDYMTVKSDAVFKYSFWYNKGLGAEMMPNAFMSGFEQMGAATATFAFKNKTVKCKGFAEQENLFCGGPKSKDYRSALIKYGNEWWVPFYSDQISGLFCMTGRYRDAGIFYQGKYYIPSDYKVTPLEGNTSFIIDVEFGNNNKLHLIVTLWGWDPALYEHWGNCSGTVNGTKLTNGYSWLEHIPQGGVNNSPPPTAKK